MAVVRKIHFIVDWDEGNIDNEFDADVEFDANIDFDDHGEVEDFLSDWLSEEYGYCHEGFSYEIIG